VSDAATFRTTRVVEARDVDPLGHVNNAVWVRYIVSLATAHAESVGLGTEATRALGGQWIVRRHEVDYHRPAIAGDTILEDTWIESLRGARSVRCARFSRRDGTLLVSSRTEWAFVDVESLRPRRIPPQVQAAFTPHDAPPPAAYVEPAAPDAAQRGRIVPAPPGPRRPPGPKWPAPGT
jgi:acyl-CoA thioester hydrolase